MPRALLYMDYECDCSFWALPLRSFIALEFYCLRAAVYGKQSCLYSANMAQMWRHEQYDGCHDDSLDTTGRIGSKGGNAFYAMQAMKSFD